MFFISIKSCFQLEDALASGSRMSPNLGQHCQTLIYNLLAAFIKLNIRKHYGKGV